MNIFLELFIVFVACEIIIWFYSLFAVFNDKHSYEGMFLVSDEVRKNNYTLKKSKIVFFHVFVLTRKWKK